LLQDLEALNTNPAATVGIPRAIGTVFERQLRRLDTTGRSVLDLAAVLGRRLAELALYEVVALPTAAAAQALSRLRDEGFLREVGGEIEFRNELIRAQAYYAVAGKVRQHLHGRVALQLAKAEGEDGPPNLEVAWHFLRAGDSRGAIPYALNGAERAITVGGPREAEQVLEALLHAQMDEGTATKAKLLLAKALMEQSKGGAAIPILLLLKSIPVLSILDRAEVTGLLATALYLANDEKANEAASEALESARQAGDISLLAQALFAFARAGIEEGKSERVEQALRECEALLALPSGNEEPMVLYTRAYCEFHYSFDAERADQDLQRAIAILGDSASPTKLSRFCSGVGHCKLVKLELDAAQSALTRAMDLALRVGDDSRASVIANAKCAVEAVRGDVTQAIGLARWSLDLGRRALNQPSLIGIYMNLADLYALAGQHDLETEAIHKAHSLLEAPHSWWAEVDFFLHLASCALIHGNTPMALQQASEAERLIGGREHAVQDASIMYKFRVFRTLHLHGPDEALQEADAALRLFRGKNPLYYYNVLVSKAWAERIALGENLGETLDELRAFASRPVMGVRTISIAQGFIRE